MPRGAVVIRIAASQKNASILEPGFTHEMPSVIQLTCHHEEFFSCGIINFNVLASASYEQTSGSKLHGFVRQLEAAVIQWRSGDEFSGARIVNFCTAHGPVPIAFIRPTRNQHPSIGKESSGVFVTRSEQASC